MTSKLPRQVSGSSTQTWNGKDAVTVTELDWDGPRPMLRIRVSRQLIELDAKQWGFVARNAERLFHDAGRATLKAQETK